ncbi:MAG: hypothetical protein AABZ16_01235, partial [candidate division NC10 bacterium]
APPGQKSRWTSSTIIASVLESIVMLMDLLPQKRSAVRLFDRSAVPRTAKRPNAPRSTLEELPKH